MAEKSRGGLFRTRNVLGGALIAGIGFGIYLGQFKGFGLGGSGTWGIGQKAGETQTSIGDAGKITSVPDSATDSDTPDDTTPLAVTNVVKVLIDDRTYFLRQPNEDISISLPKLIKLVQQAPGDSDGVRLRVYQRSTARVSAEEKLKDDLVAAGIPDTAVFWVPGPVK